MKKLPILCPSCASGLHVQSLVCGACGTAINGTFDLPVLAKLEPKEQQIVLDFVLSSGSLKQMAQKMGVSYPTVRNMLDDLILKLEKQSHGKEA
ncbi:MAG: DUF2089 family protein [Breznakibacter sp.]